MLFLFLFLIIFVCFLNKIFYFCFFFFLSSAISSLFCFWGSHDGRFFLFYSFNCLLLHSSCEGCRVLPAQLLHSHTHRHAHDDGPVRLACCTHEEGPRRTAR
ncbi:hypothetical protein TCDM_10301 [Trypanosoma cruzi Dm28c]|uniref:Uncharacterized protein n=1 Tax=Trypanosoma cruzi Dm28c TaxID=1416333 RepID=V5BCF6_TRYCR|nr:hypothetical protein TCDM_10301 [Trypanosoma cruzi Dm28c]